MSISNSNINGVSVDEHFRMSWYTKQSSELFNDQRWYWTTYEAINAEEMISTCLYILSERYLIIVSVIGF